MKRLVTCFLLSLVFACSDRKAPETNEEQEQPSSIYPIGYFFMQQVREVDSLQLPTVRYRDIANKKDTVAISLAEFKDLAQQFIDSDISSPSLRKEYQESNFADQSAPNITFNYTTTNKKLPVRRIDVILDPSPVMDDKVKSIYIEKQEKSGDTLIMKRLLWKSHKSFQVYTSKKLPKQEEQTSQVKVAWDNSDEY